MDETYLEQNAIEVEDALESLYRPGAYAEGEQLCLHIFEDVDPDWEPAKLFLVLNLAAQGAEQDALELIDELSDESLIEALRHLAFGEGSESEEMVYEDIVLCAQERGLEHELEQFFETREKPLERHQKADLPERWKRKGHLGCDP